MTKQQTQTPDSPSPLTAANITTDYVMNQLFDPPPPRTKHISTCAATMKTTIDVPSPLTAANITTENILNAFFPDSPPSSTNSSIHNTIDHQLVNIRTQDMWDSLLPDTPPSASTDNSPSYVYPLPPRQTKPDVLDAIFPPISP